MAGIGLMTGFSSCSSKGKAPKEEMAESVESVAGDTTLASEARDSGSVAEKPESNYPFGVQALLAAYPDQIKGFEDGYLVMSSGKKILYDDGKQKGFTEMLDNSSPKDMFYVAYKLPDGEPEYQMDAGRSRSEELFKAMYGSSASEAQSKLVPVDWFGQRLQFTSVNGGAEQLKKAAAELAQHPELSKYMKSMGTFYWRQVRGANRLSAHSYGIAIDIGEGNSDYWLWKHPGASEEAKISYSNKMPREIAEIMQKYGFVWGGAWYHFDTMHFEYRPEILKYAELSRQQ